MVEQAQQQGATDAVCKSVRNLPFKWDAESLKSYLSEQNIAFSDAKKRKNSDVGSIDFATIEEAEQAKQKLEEVIIAPSRKRCKFTDDGDEKSDEVEPKDICEVVTPLAGQPYEEQLRIKKESVATVLRKFARHTRKCCDRGSTLPEWLSSTKDREGLACQFEGIIASPVVEGYRNKCEFTIGCSTDGKRVVGFQLGMFKNGVTAVASASNCRNVSVFGKFYAAALEEYVNLSELPVWDKENNSGFWRMLTVREGRNLQTSQDEVLIIVQVSPAGMTDEAKTNEYKRILQALSAAGSKSSPPVPLTCFTIQEHDGVSNAAPSNAPLIPLTVSGKEDEEPAQNIHDSIGDLQFRISSTSFFQVNTLAAEKLYALAGEWAGLGPNTLLFDVCCGTGTIGLSLARKVGMVVGIELNAEAVEDAWTNAKLNNISNCKFVCAKAEDVIKDLLNEYEVLPADSTEEATISDDKKQFSNIVVIVDPPRSGLHPSVVKTLRVHSRLKRLVYISCNPDTLVANAIELCAPLSSEQPKGKQHNTKGMSNLGYARRRVKNMPASDPFKPVKAVAVDLFPHTHHCEMVMLLER